LRGVELALPEKPKTSNEDEPKECEREESASHGAPPDMVTFEGNIGAGSVLSTTSIVKRNIYRA